MQTATSTLGSPARDIQPPALTIDQTRQVMIENSVKVKQERQAYLGRLRQMKDSFAARLRGANVNSMPEILRPSSSVAEKPGLADAPLIVRKDQDGYHIDDVQNPDVLGNERPSSRDYLREIQADRTSLVRKDAPTIHERAKANLGRLIGLIKRG